MSLEGEWHYSGGPASCRAPALPAIHIALRYKIIWQLRREGHEASQKACPMKCVKEKGAEWVFVDTVYIKNENAVNEDRDLGEEAKPT